ncbi:MAG: hypothetical protein K0R93_2385 [Anaerosolibacter sp.]|jgi:hypothetical protein|uniref:hypothetical protein n=1 Tax=Anaerosolibacter sp. TaxID=1872527 RepID=UPI0026062B83|nr:hypothetical protein [Anaerosolibacter sp.]MDF2547487.1 hypothetical protein [Anaerosolibacter sp.]
MAMDVFDRSGKHIGVVHKRFPYAKNVCMVALTDVRAADLHVNMDKIRKHVAAGYDCKNILGTIDDEKLENVLDGLLGRESRNTLIYDQRIMAVFLMEFGEKAPAAYMDESVLENRITGYILCDIKKCSFREGGIIIKENIDCYSEQIGIDWLSSAVYATIIDYPVLDTDIMGAMGMLIGADLADLGGRNHRHSTEIRIKSGNYEDCIRLPIVIDCKKDMNIYLNVVDQKIDKVFCDGRIYRFW